MHGSIAEAVVERLLGRKCHRHSIDLTMTEEEHSRLGNWRGRLRRVLRRGLVAHESRNPALELNEPELMQRSITEMEHSTFPSIANTYRSIDSIVDLPVECAPNQVRPVDEQQTPPRVSDSTTVSDLNLQHADGYQLPVTGVGNTSSTGFDVNTHPTFLRGIFNIWDNRLALKLFGSRRGILIEEERLKNCPHWVIHPCSKFR